MTTSNHVEAPKGHFFRVVYAEDGYWKTKGVRVELRKKLLIGSKSINAIHVSDYNVNDVILSDTMRSLIRNWETLVRHQQREAEKKENLDKYVGNYPPKRLT